MMKKNLETKVLSKRGKDHNQNLVGQTIDTSNHYIKV